MSFELVADESEEPLFRLQVPVVIKLLKITTNRVRHRTWLWAELDPTAPPRELVLRAYQTGEPVPEGAVYVDTVAGTDTWHVYELPPDVESTPRSTR